MIKAIVAVYAIVLTAGCTSPLSTEVRERIDPALEFTAVQDNPQRFLGKSLMLGGSVVTMQSDQAGSLLEILRWELNRWGEPLALLEAGDRFLVYTPQLLDPDLYTRGRLVTLGGTVKGTAEITINEHKEKVPLFDLLEIHLWDTPYRYGLHQNPDPGAPEYVTPVNPGPDHPYDPTPWAYPHSPFWYRNK